MRRWLAELVVRTYGAKPLPAGLGIPIADFDALALVDASTPLPPLVGRAERPSMY